MSPLEGRREREGGEDLRCLPLRRTGFFIPVRFDENDPGAGKLEEAVRARAKSREPPSRRSARPTVRGRLPTRPP